MITDLQDILKTVIYAPPPQTFEHNFKVLPTRASVRKEKAAQLWKDIKQKEDHK